MKTIIIGALMLMNLSANASSYVRYESVHFESASAWIPGDLVCRNGNTLNHIKKKSISVKVCDSTGIDTDKNCKVVEKPLSQPVVSIKKVCTQFSGKDDSICVKEKIVKNDQSVVNVYSVNGHESGVEKLIGKYTIPSCQDL